MTRTGSDWIAPDCAGMDFYAADRSLRDLLEIYLPEDVRSHFTPHFQRMGPAFQGRVVRQGEAGSILLGSFVERGAVERIGRDIRDRAVLESEPDIRHIFVIGDRAQAYRFDMRHILFH